MQTCIEQYSSQFDDDTVILLQKQTNLIQIADQTRFKKQLRRNQSLLNPGRFRNGIEYEKESKAMSEMIEYMFTLDDTSKQHLLRNIQQSRVHGYARIIIAEQIGQSDLSDNTKKDLLLKISPLSEKITNSLDIEKEEKEFLLSELNKGDERQRCTANQIYDQCKSNFLDTSDWQYKVAIALSHKAPRPYHVEKLELAANINAIGDQVSELYADALALRNNYKHRDENKLFDVYINNIGRYCLQKFLGLGFSERSSLSLSGSLIFGAKTAGENALQTAQAFYPQTGGTTNAADNSVEEKIGRIMKFQSQQLESLQRKYLSQKPNEIIRR